MVLRNVTYVNAKDLTNTQKEVLGLAENVNKGIIAVETHNSNYTRKGVLIKKGIVNYILRGE